MKELAKKLLAFGGFGGAMYGMGLTSTSGQAPLTLTDFFTVAFSAVVLALTVTLVGVALTVVPVTDL
jgi:hypothetical protein